MNQVDGMIQDDWAGEPEIRDACARIWEALSKQDRHLDHYTFFHLQQLAGDPSPDVLTKALMYLSNPRLRVLSTCLMYEDDGHYFELPVEEVAHYAKGEELIHPRFGEPLPEEDVVVCFTPGEALQSGAAQ